ncbi:MAG: Fic family protein [Bdellovibrionales bacterium]|nr:Fic family protein [Bdellovibrionales bacterium]
MKRGLTGDYRLISKVGGEVAQAFIPKKLPPLPPVEITSRLREKIDQALLWLGRLDSVSTLLPDTELFLYTYVRKEAVLSSQIEGTQSSLSDLMLFELKEIPGVPIDDVQEVSSYVSALNYGLKRIRDGFPLSNRLIREIHDILLKKGRGADKKPGEFRTSQNWIGGTRPGNAHFVPPPPDMVTQCMSDLELFLHNKPEAYTTLQKAALAHVQFETIHPFLDGNGRVGRLLITLLFCSEGMLQEPLLYLSLYFKKHRNVYYDLLQEVRLTGDWEKWLSFFVDAVQYTASEAVDTAQKLTKLFKKDRERLTSVRKGKNSALQVHEELTKKPIVTIKALKKRTGMTVPTITSALKRLIELKIAKEITGRKRNRVFVYGEYMKILEV